jgi:hypothetical protein
MPARPDAPEEGSTGGSVVLVFTSYRVKLCDPDNLEIKFVVDALRYCHLIRNDSPKDIAEIRVRQVQVPHFSDEHTEIKICNATRIED